MFRLLDARSDRYEVSFAGDTRGGRNKINLLTGPNGSGKTTLLTDLAAVFRGGRTKSSQVFARWQIDQVVSSNGSEAKQLSWPERVVAQTFSPFSRFPAPADDMLSLTDVYSEGLEREETYRVVGIHRRSRFVGAYLARHTLEQGIFRLTESAEHTEAMAQVLLELGFKDRVVLRYRPLKEMAKVLEAHSNGMLVSLLETTVASWESRESRLGASGFASATSREARATGGLNSFSDLLGQALELVQRTRTDGPEFELDVLLGMNKASGDFAVLQALALLRRLRLIGLQRCALEMQDGPVVDLADASSGQQQMICSIFGLVAELRSNSLVLIDEPELSLHPTWQSSYLDRLTGLLKPFDGCHVLVATHSALLVQRGLAMGMDVMTLGRKVGAPTVVSNSENRLVRHQVSVEETLLDVFHTPIKGSVFLANELFSLVTRVEESGTRVQRESVLARLSDLRATFASDQSAEGDLVLIEKAIDLVKTAADDQVPGGAAG